jgi:hypothetical protein
LLNFLLSDLALLKHEATRRTDHLKIDVAGAFTNSIWQESLTNIDLCEDLRTIHPRYNVDHNALEIISVNGKSLARNIILFPKAWDIFNHFRRAAIINKVQFAHRGLLLANFDQLLDSFFVGLFRCCSLPWIRQFIILDSGVPIEPEVRRNIQNVKRKVILEECFVIHQTLHRFDVRLIRQVLQIVNQEVELGCEDHVRHQVEDNLPFKVLLRLYLIVERVELDHSVHKQIDLPNDRLIDIVEFGFKRNLQFLALLIRLKTQQLHVVVSERALELFNELLERVLAVRKLRFYEEYLLMENLAQHQDRLARLFLLLLHSVEILLC